MKQLYRLFVLLQFCITPVAAAQDTTRQTGPVSTTLLAGTRINGFVVGSFHYNSRIQLVPEFAGGAPRLSEPGATSFRFDKFGIGASRVFSSWLSASAALEVESHRDSHSHGFDPDFGCFGDGPCIERFGSEEAEIEVNLDKFAVNLVAPVGNGLTVSVGRFDVPFGIERHDEILLLTATSSEVFRFGRPDKMTGLQMNYTFSPEFDASFWIVNRMESETTHDDFNDNNKGKSVGGRFGITPIHGNSTLNFGVGTFFGSEREEEGRRALLDLDFSYSRNDGVLLAAEFVYGSESHVSFRERGIPFTSPAIEDADVSWYGFYGLGHCDVKDWLGLSVRYGLFQDEDGARTGVAQRLQSITFGPTFHLSRLIPGLRSTGVSYARTRHPIDWVDLKVEWRINFSDEPVFSDAGPAVDILEAEKSSHQFQTQVVVNF